MELIQADVGRPFADLARRFEDQALADDARRVLETLVPAEATVLSGDGRTYDRRILPYRTAVDRIEGVVVTFVDITERRRAEAIVKASEERQVFLLRLTDALRPLADPVAIEIEAARVLGEQLRVDRAFYCEVEPDEDHIVIRRDFVALGMASFAGRARLSDFGHHWAEGYRAGRTLTTNDARQVAGSQPATFEAAGFRACVGVPINKDGRLVGILIVHSAAPREWTESEVSLIEATAERTWAAVEHAKVQEALQVSEKKYRDLFDSMDQGYCIIEMIPDKSGAFADWRFLEMNPAFEKNNGLTNTIGKTIRELVPAIEKKWFDIYGKVALTGEPNRFIEYSAAMSRWFDVYAFRVDESEQRRVAVLFTDITHRKRQEAAVREGERQYRTLAANLPGGAAFVVDRDLRYRLAEGEAMKTAGFATADFEGKTIFEVLPPEVAADYESNYRRALAGESFRQEHLSYDRWFITHGVPLREGGGDEVTGVLAVSYDITERKLAEQRALEGERRFGLVVENLVDYAIFLLSPTGIITGWWEGAERVTGYGNEAVGQHFRIFYPSELASEPDHELRTASENGRSKVEGWRIHKNGSRYWVNEIITAIHDKDRNIAGFAKIARDLTQRKRAEEELYIAKENAEAASHAKDEFLATLSHELRTPLSAILLWSTLLRTAETPSQIHDGLDAIQQSADAQKRLIEDLLDSARIGSGKMRLEMLPTNLSVVVEATIESIRPTARAKNVSIHTEFDPKVGVVTADQERMRQIVWNLLSNAVKFTPEGGRVDISLVRTDGHVELRVRDSGRGMERSFLPHIFERFRQQDSATTRRTGGLGLGLAITRQLAEMHNGSVTAESEGEGKGSTFIVSLPLPRKTSRRSAKTIASPAEKIPKIQPVLSRLDGVRILFVEDELHTRTATTQLLKQSGAIVDEAEDAPSAVTLFTNNRPDVLLSDIGLPGEDGVSLLARLRALDANRADIPAIALTAFAMKRDVDRASKAGFAHVVIKPFQPAELTAMIAVLSQRSM